MKDAHACAGLSTADSSVTYLSSFGNVWSPKSRSRNLYRGGKGSTSVSRSFIVRLAASRSTSPPPTFPAQGRLQAHGSVPSPSSPSPDAGRPLRASSRRPRPPAGAGQAPAGGGAEGGARRPHQIWQPFGAPPLAPPLWLLPYAHPSGQPPGAPLESALSSHGLSRPSSPSSLGQRSPPPSSGARPPSSPHATPSRGCSLPPFLLLLSPNPRCL